MPAVYQGWLDKGCPSARRKDYSGFGIVSEQIALYTGTMNARFSELNKVRTTCEELGHYEGYVVASLFKDGRWIYKISISDDTKGKEIFDNWIPEECLEIAK